MPSTCRRLCQPAPQLLNEGDLISSLLWLRRWVQRFVITAPWVAEEGFEPGPLGSQSCNSLHCLKCAFKLEAWDWAKRARQLPETGNCWEKEHARGHRVTRFAGGEVAGVCLVSTVLSIWRLELVKPIRWQKSRG